MAGKIEIVNFALTKLGANRVLSLNDNTEEARVINGILDVCIESELRKIPWNFAIVRATLPALSAAPVWGYEYQYELPQNYLSLVQVNDVYYRGTNDKTFFTIEGRKILTDVPAPLKVRFVQSITDYTLLDSLFVDVLSNRLALEACERITQSNTKKSDLANMYKESFKIAIARDAIELPPTEFQDGTWLDSRYAGRETRTSRREFPFFAYPSGYEV